MEEFIDQLNEKQHEAVVNYMGPSLVIAGAGAGKTRVLTYRIAYLLSQGVKAHRILALTFTNKAAKEMKERISSLVGDDKARNLWMGTFHSIFAKILRFESERLGYKSSYTIYDTVDSKNLIKKIIKDLKLDDKTYKPNEVLSRISAAKNNLITPVNYANNPQIYERDRAAKKPEIHRIYKQYAQRIYKSGVMDFDDLLMNTNILFRDNTDILEKYQQKFDYILVDEYQDTNYSQYLIIKKLAATHKNLCVVGDDAQSIYSFRGAKIENILNFKNDYKNYKLYKLEQNYRSTKNIVNAANSLIAKNKNKIEKKVWSSKEQGSKIRILKASTDTEEGFIIANRIMDIRMAEHFEYYDFAILYRTNAQSRIFEEALRKKNIPYKIHGGISFYQRKEIKDLLAYFRLIINPSDEEALKRIINYPARGIGKTTLDKIEKFSITSGITMWECLLRIDEFDIGLNNRSRNKLKEFAAFIIHFAKKLFDTDAYELAHEVASASTLLKELYNDKTPEGISRYENIQELLNGIREFSETRQNEGSDPILTAYMENVALLTNEDNETEEDKNKVSLMTIHASKGLEFANVFVVGVEHELFPNSFASNSSTELEEERRLFYVAITRAMVNVFLSYASLRYKWGSPVDSSPSRFIREIEPQYVDFSEAGLFQHNESKVQTGLSDKRIPQSTGLTQKTTPSNPNEIAVGMKVEHARFGVGKVLSMEGNYPSTKATVFFEKAGQKQLLLKFAKLRIVK